MSGSYHLIGAPNVDECSYVEGLTIIPALCNVASRVKAHKTVSRVDTARFEAIPAGYENLHG